MAPANSPRRGRGRRVGLAAGLASPVPWPPFRPRLGSSVISRGAARFRPALRPRGADGGVLRGGPLRVSSAPRSAHPTSEVHPPSPCRRPPLAPFPAHQRNLRRIDDVDDALGDLGINNFGYFSPPQQKGRVSTPTPAGSWPPPCLCLQWPPSSSPPAPLDTANPSGADDGWGDARAQD